MAVGWVERVQSLGAPPISENLKQNFNSKITGNCFCSVSWMYYIIIRGELSYLAPLGSENFSAPYFKQCFFQRGVLPHPPD